MMIRRTGRARILCSWAFAACSQVLLPAQAEVGIGIGQFDPAVPAVSPPWQIIQLERHVPATQFRSVRWDGVGAIEARAQRSMALLGRTVNIDLKATPVLCWRWRIDAVVKGADMSKRSGDDYAARVYLAFMLPRDALSLVDKAALALARGVYGPSVPDGAINYVWDNRYPEGTRKPNAYTSRAQMVVRRSGNGDAGQWVGERVNVLDDAIAAFGSNEPKVVLVAIASDTDNTGDSARAGFADLHFVGQHDRCAFEREPASTERDQGRTGRPG